MGLHNYHKFLKITLFEHKKVYDELCKYADTQLHKIEFIYAVSKMSSYPSVDYMLEHKLFSEGTKTASMGKYFDPYFNFEGSTYV